MRVSEVLSGSVETFLTLAPEMQDHLDSAENPHKVTKKQVGLGNVTDEKQATDADFRSHKTAPVLDHPAASVTTEKLQNGAVTQEKIADGAVGSAALQKGSVENTHLHEVVRNKIDGKVDKVEGMGLSHNSFTDAEKAKLGAIAVTDGAQLQVDTEALVLKSKPLCLKKTGTRLIKEKERVLVPPNVIEQLLTATTDLQSGMTYVIGQKSSDILAVYFVKDGVMLKRHYATDRDVCQYVDKDTVYFGELQGGYANIKKFDGTASPWKQFAVKVSSATTLQDFHVLEDRVVLIYTCDANEGEMHVESFALDGSREWEYVTGSVLREAYADTDVYTRRFPKSVMVGDELYFAPVLDSISGHAALRLDRNGNCTGKYMPITNYTVETDVLSGLTFSGGSLYGFISEGYLVRIDTQTEKVYKAYCEGTEGGTLLGLQVGRGEKVAFYVENADTGVKRLYQIDGKTVTMEKDMFPPAELMADMDESYESFCITNEGYEFLRYETDGVNGYVYQGADTFSVL